MRFVTFLAPGAEPQPGVIEGNSVVPLACPTLIDYLLLAPEDRPAPSRRNAIALNKVRLDAPVRPPKNIFCVGWNYKTHVDEGARARGVEQKLPTVPTFFTKATTAIVGPDCDLHLSPAVSAEYDWEAELAVIIGARCRDVSERDALSVVFGYTCLNDLSARDLQREHKQWFKGKSLDESCPIGPWIVSADELGDPQQLKVVSRVNGVVKQSASTSTMIFSVATIIAQLSRGMTLEPGDVIATGTPEGVGFARTPPEFLTDGDVVEIEVEKIGVLRNWIRLV